MLVIFEDYLILINYLKTTNFAARFEPFQQCQKTPPVTGYIWHWIIEMHIRETQRKLGGVHNQARERKTQGSPLDKVALI